jgi:selenocysteine-specific elongation factor
LSGDAFAKMRDVVIALIREKGTASVSELRQALGSSRRIVVPLLERFDREGVTRRLGDKRTLR